MTRKIVSAEEVSSIREQLRGEGRVVVQCHGCFDIVHPGHIRYLRFAKEQGDVLIVSVSGDEMVGKGVGRPYVNEQLRAENLAALEFVDYVTIDPHEWAGPILDRIRPDIYVKGKEYDRSADPRFLREKALVEDYGGKVIFSSGDVIYSSTFIVDQFRDRFRLEHDQIAAYCRRHEITRPALDALLKKFRDVRVVVLGDPIIDRYVHCDALGIAGETPMINVTPIREDVFAGAAALIAMQMAILGARVRFVTVMRDHDESAAFVDVLRNHDVEVIAVTTDDRPLFSKTRFIVDDQKLFKVDYGRLAPPSTAATEELLSVLERELREADGLAITDFGYGLFSADLIDGIHRLTRDLQRPYYVDVSGSRRANILRFPQPRIATPAELELRFALADNEAGLSNLAARYFGQTQAEHLVLTMGKRGLLLFDAPEAAAARLSTEFLPALSEHAVDTVGAGDVFLAAVILADLAGAHLPLGAYLGSCLAALQVGRLGNDPLDGSSVYEYVHSRAELRE